MNFEEGIFYKMPFFDNRLMRQVFFSIIQCERIIVNRSVAVIGIREYMVCGLAFVRKRTEYLHVVIGVVLLAGDKSFQSNRDASFPGDA